MTSNPISDPSERLAARLRPVPVLSDKALIGDALDLFQRTGMAYLPLVNHHGTLEGIVRLERIQSTLQEGNADRGLASPAAQLLDAPRMTLDISTPCTVARTELAAAQESAALVTDGAGRMLGLVHWVDLAVPVTMGEPPIPAAGMATVSGVFLTYGGYRAGVSSLSLVVGGAVVGLMIAASFLAVGFASYLLDRALGTQALALLHQLDPPGAYMGLLAWLGLQSLAVIVFLAALRVSPITAYHGAEHMAVHALERGLPLTAEYVSRMPRVHPRCGTNLMTGAAVFLLPVVIAAAVMPGLTGAVLGSCCGAALCMRTWRPLGLWVQDRITTKRPSPTQLDRAIDAARDLRTQYHSVAWTSSRGRRLWHSGIAQTALGVLVGLGAPLIVIETLLGVL